MFASGLASPPALAAEPSAADKDQARDLARGGDESFAQGNYKRALAQFSAAYRLVHVPTVGIEVAKTLEAMGRWVEARAVAQEVVGLPVRIGEPDVFQTARTAARALSATLSERLPTLTVRVLPFDANARLVLDGAEKAVVAAPVQLDPGTHRVRVEAAGYSPVTRRVPLAPGDENQLQVVLTPLWQPQQAPAQAASASEPAALPPASGPSGGRARSSQQNPDAGPTKTADGATPDRDAARTRAYIGLGIGGAAALAWSVTGLLAFATKPDCPKSGCDPSREGDIDASLRYGNVANVSLVVAGIGLLYGWWEYPSARTVADESRAKLEILPRSASGIEARLSTTF